MSHTINSTRSSPLIEEDGRIPSFYSSFLSSYSDFERRHPSSDSSGPPSLTAGRLKPASSDIFLYDSSFDLDVEPGPEVQYEDDVFEPDQPARFRDARIPSDFKQLFFFENLQKVQEYNLLWKGIVDILTAYQVTNAYEITCPLVLTETLKQLIVGQKLSFKKFQVEVTMHNMTRSPNFSVIGAKISTLQRYLTDLHFWLKEEMQKAVLDRSALQDQHLHLDSYLTYLEKKKQLLQDAFSSYPYDEALREEAYREKVWSYHLRHKLVKALTEFNQTREEVYEAHEEKINVLFEQENQICTISEQFEISSLLDAAIKSVLGQSERGEQMTEEDEELIEDWCLTLGQLYNDRADHMVSIIEECEAFRSEVTEQETILFVSKKNAERLDFEVSLFSDNSILKNENITRLRDIIRKGRDPTRAEHADLYAVRGVNMPDESFGQRLFDENHLISTPQRFADEQASMGITSPMQTLQVSKEQHHMTPIQRSESPVVAEAMLDEAFYFFDQPSREISDQPINLSMKQVESAFGESPGVEAIIEEAFDFLDQPSSREVIDQALDLSRKRIGSPVRHSPGLAESAMIDDAFGFLDQASSGEVSAHPLDISQKFGAIHKASPGIEECAVIDDAFGFLDESSSSGVSQQPLQSTFMASSGSARPMQHLHISPREGDISSFAADPPRSVFYPISERAVPKPKKQKSLIPKLDRSRMKKAAQTTRDRSLYAVSEHPSTSKPVPFPRKGKKRVQPSKRPPWNFSTRIPTAGIMTKMMPPMSQSLKVKSSPAFGKTRMNKTAPLKGKSRPKSLIPIRVPHTSYKLKSPRTPYRTFNAPRPQFRQMNRTFDTSLQLNMRSDDWRLKSKYAFPKTLRIPDAAEQSDRTFYPTPPIYRKGWLRGKNPIIPPFINPLPGAGA